MTNNLLKSADEPTVNKEMLFGTESVINLVLRGKMWKRANTDILYWRTVGLYKFIYTD